MSVAIAILIIAAVVAVIAAGAGIWLTEQRKRSERLRTDFGPEYDRALDEYGSRGEAESRLRERQDRVAKLRLKPISATDRSRFASQWTETQARFVDGPSAAVADAQRLVDSAMNARGFPLGEFDQRAEDLSVEHPAVVSNYRAARDIAQANDRGDADTEALRQAMVHYRALFRDLVNVSDPADTMPGRSRYATDGRAADGRPSRMDTPERAQGRR